jgi:hypothetical protein
MLEKLMLRAAAIAERAAERRRTRLARELQDEAPGGVGVEIEEESVVLSGRRLVRRYASDPALRALLEPRR